MTESASNDNSPKTDISIDGQLIAAFCKKNYVILLIVACMIFGFYLRSYHMNFPVIGYHNMKENQYIPYTEFMYNADEFLDYFRTETYWIGAQEHGYFTQYEFPLIPWITLAVWKVIGINVGAARFIIIVFSLASIPVLYAVGKKLTDNTAIVLAACFFYTIMPISVFFGRNVQPEAPGLFFILLATYFFLCWREEILVDKNAYKQFLLFSISILTAVLLKIPNGIGLIPLLFFVPYKKVLSQKKYAASLIVMFILILAMFPIWVNFSQWTMPEAATVGTSGFRESLQEVKANIAMSLSTSYWSEHYGGIKAFVKDNFTFWFFWLAVLGVCFASLKYNTKISLFVIGSFISVIVYILCFADKFRGHAYYQMVFVPFVCFATAYALYVLASTISQQINGKYQEYIFVGVCIVILALSYSSVTAATARAFDVIYYGEDIAGEFINQNSDPRDRIFIDGVSSQSVGILWHAHRYGIEEIPANLSWFQELEDTLQFRWVVLYGPGIGTAQTKTEVWEYIQNTYKIRQVGFIIQDNQYVPFYFVLEKGGVVNLEEFVKNKTPSLAGSYEKTYETVDMYTIDDVMNK
jgi:4-amino-4-deoxy-L-arabinose transferase-like glycosyltransferase